ncbi:MAG: 30S ribosomal protein S16 [Candidatus Cyclobacteriaceae bacterium M2_1C_046]
MAVKIRLARRGRKKLAIYDVVVADVRAPRDGKYIERIGRYNPNTNPATIDLNEDRAFYWVMNGAQPTDTVKAMLSYRGLLLKKHLQIGVNKGALTQEEADKKFNEWVEQKGLKIQSKQDKLASEAEQMKAARKEAESKVREARAEELKKKLQAEEEPAEEATAEGGEEATAEGGEEPTAEGEGTQPEASAEEKKEGTSES